MSDSFWEATYRRNIGKMIGICCRYTQDRQTAEDLAHDAFVIAIDKVSSFENRGPFEAWLRQIVVNVALQYLRAQKQQEKLGQNAYPAIYDHHHEESPDNDLNAFSEQELLSVIGQLPEHHRLVFNLYVIDNFTHAQIAAQLGISEGTSKSHLARARKKIRVLLHLLLTNNKERKRAFLFIIFPHRIWHIDQLFTDILGQFSIPPRAEHLFHQVDLNGAAIPKYQPLFIQKSTYLKTGALGIATAGLLAGISIFSLNTNNQEHAAPILFEKDSSAINLTQVNVKQKANQKALFPDTSAATIPENPIISEKPKNLEEMKNLSTLGGLMLAGLTLDSARLIPELPVRFKAQDITETRNVKPAEQEIVKSAANRKGRPLSGTFYASEIHWSEKNNELFLLGKNVKVDFNTQKFTGSGRFSFISQFGYLVIDGKPVELNETVKLAENKYHFRELREADGIRKYGDKGKGGVVEIALAD
ncbi:RNA polymerase sigma factor [Dyadobacter aurulentus]|uniref:RNA polymerase sigma factor n=1 Tax=Dyadobacter sp. UC 10 TaxID=2605428 RepID=UPI0011F0C964|nr:RNA polymerase sigma factor [Dyadobacter sp. UC 10]KAA0993340.1 RNA polymerase sigma factor [Dyadobacter sp. UC 10]